MSDAPHGTEYAILLGAFTLGAFLVLALFAWIDARRERERLVTVRAFLEKGEAIPPTLVHSPAVEHASRLRRGVTLIAAGAAVSAAFALNPGFEGTWAVGLVPIAVGMAALAGAWLTRPR